MQQFGQPEKSQAVTFRPYTLKSMQYHQGRKENTNGYSSLWYISHPPLPPGRCYQPFGGKTNKFPCKLDKSSTPPCFLHGGRFSPFSSQCHLNCWVNLSYQRQVEVRLLLFMWVWTLRAYNQKGSQTNFNDLINTPLYSYKYYVISGPKPTAGLLYVILYSIVYSISIIIHSRSTYG